MESNIESKSISLDTIWDKGGRDDLQSTKNIYPIWQSIFITILVAAVFFVLQGVFYLPIVESSGMTGFTLFTGASALLVWGGGLLLFGILTKKLSWEDIKAKPVQFGGIKWVIGTLGIALISYIIVMIISIVMLMILPVQPSETRGDLVMGGGVLWIGILVGSILVPIAEELFFRGFLFTTLRKRTNFWISAILSAVCFGLVHGDPIAIIYAFVLGLIFAATYERSKSIYISILLHMLINFISTMVSYVVLTYFV